MGPQYRTIRAVASALLVSAAVGTGGMAGMTSVLAADPALVGLAGTVVNHDGRAPLAGVPLVVTEMVLPDGGSVAAQTTTGADGTFGIELQALGTADTPAIVTFRTPPNTMIEVIGETCSQTWGVAIDSGQDLTLDGAAPDRLTLKATTTLIGEVCGTTGVPATGQSGGGSSRMTPPPTDTSGVPNAADADRLAPALTIGFVVSVLAAAALLLPRPRARRRD